MYSTITKLLAFFETPKLNRGKSLMGQFCLITISILLISLQSSGQAADIDQIRNGPSDNPQKWFYSSFNNPSYVNGNAGASTAHYVEGMSISYRSLLTGLTVGQQYEYTLEYDTRQGSKQAIDYLTHYQRLEPHSPFGHTAEVINPRIYILNGKEYQIGLSAGTNPNTFPIPAPATTGTPVAGQPLTSFNALPAAEKLMTIYNGTISSIVYAAQGTLANAAAASSIRIRFQAAKDSVVLAWGGHIASRLDWGFVGGVPRSAGGISGSSYHMRHLSMRTFPGLVNIPLGNQDRSLSAAAVIPPPLCPTVTSQTICAGGSFGAFTITNPDAGTTYNWSFGTNTAGATFTGGGTTATGTSVTVVKTGGFTGGTFTLNISAVKNGITISCPSVATGTVEVVVVTATANPTTIDIKSAAHNSTLTANIGASSTDPNNANYTYQWDTIGTPAGSLTNANTRIATYTADILDAGQTLKFRVTATQNADPNSPECSDVDTVEVQVGVIGVCQVSDTTTVCAGSQITHNGSPNPKEANTTYEWTLEAIGGGGSTTSTIVGATNGVSVVVNAIASYRIVLTQTYANTSLSPSVCFQEVSVTQIPSVSATYIPPACDETTFKVTVNSPTIGLTYDVSQPGNSTDYTPITPTAGSPNVEFTNLVQGDGWRVIVSTGVAGCADTADCETNPVPITSNNSVVEPEAEVEKADAKKANDLKSISDNVTETYDIRLESSTKVKALPNPFTEKVRFNLVSGVSGIATLEIHNTLGQKVAVVYQGYLQAGRELSKEFYVPVKDRGALLYTFRVGDQKVTGKLIAR